MAAVAFRDANSYDLKNSTYSRKVMSPETHNYGEGGMQLERQNRESNDYASIWEWPLPNPPPESSGDPPVVDVHFRYDIQDGRQCIQDGRQCTQLIGPSMAVGHDHCRSKDFVETTCFGLNHSDPRLSRSCLEYKQAVGFGSFERLAHY